MALSERKVNLENESLEQKRTCCNVMIKVGKKIFEIATRPIEKIQEFGDKQIKD